MLWVRRGFPFDTGDNPCQARRSHAAVLRCTNVSRIPQWGGVGARATAQDIGKPSHAYPDLHGHAKARKQRTPSAASTLTDRRPFCGTPAARSC
eukprot:5357952-Prymnesium_polylepis.1